MCVRQGRLPSMLLYNIVAEVLANLINADKRFKGLQIGNHEIKIVNLLTIPLLLKRYYLGNIQKVCSVKIPEFWTPCPLVYFWVPPPLFAFEPRPLATPVHFWAPPPPPRYVRFGWNSPSPSISVLVKSREKKLIMSTSIFAWIQRVFWEVTVEPL